MPEVVGYEYKKMTVEIKTKLGDMLNVIEQIRKELHPIMISSDLCSEPQKGGSGIGIECESELIADLRELSGLCNYAHERLTEIKKKISL